jgi:type I restriction enzyme S subunit
VTDFDTITIEEATERLIDYRGKTPPKTDSGVRLITAKVVKDGHILEEPKEFIAADFYDEWMRRGLPQKLDVLLTTEAPLGEVAVLRNSERIALAQRIILLRAKATHVDPLFLFYALQSDFGQGELKARASGTTVLGIKQSELRKVRVPIFPLPVQHRIAGILSAYDDLIENNQRRIKILEAMARSLYREWFVNFRFPGHEKVPLVDSPLGKIPQGWEVKTLDQVMNFQGGAQPPRSEWSDQPRDGYVRMIQIRDYESDKHICYVKDSPKLRKCSRTDIMIARYGASVARICAGLEGAYNVALVKVIPHSPSYQQFLRSYLQSDVFQQLLIGMSGRAAQAGFNKSSLKGINLIIPSTRELFDHYQEITKPLFQLTLNLEEKNLTLRRTRDLLLPRLLSDSIAFDDVTPEQDGIEAMTGEETETRSRTMAPV